MRRADAQGQIVQRHFHRVGGNLGTCVGMVAQRLKIGLRHRQIGLVLQFDPRTQRTCQCPRCNAPVGRSPLSATVRAKAAVILVSS